MLKILSAICFAIFACSAGQNNGVLRIVFLDVGQGDSILFIAPGGETLLIDGGPDVTTDWILQKYTSPYFCRLDLVLLTHPDADHVSGLVRVADHCHIGMIFQNYSDHNSNIYKSWLTKTAKAKSVELYVGSHFTMSDVDFYTVWPPKDLTDKKSNNHSIGLLVDHGDFEGLFLGDLENARHSEVLDNLEQFEGLIDRPFELLKASHHGALNGFDENLTSWVDPEVFVISVGKDNSYGHPNEDVLEFLKELGAKIFRTDIHGTIEISVP